MARLAISKGFLADYAKLDKQVQRTVDQAIAAFARRQDPGQHLETPEQANDDRLRLIPLDGDWRGVVIAPDDAAETYCLVTVLTQDKAAAYLTSYGRTPIPIPIPIPETVLEPPHPEPQYVVLPTPQPAPTQPLPEPPPECGPPAPSPPPGRMARLARRLHLRRPPAEP